MLEPAQLCFKTELPMKSSNLFVKRAHFHIAAKRDALYAVRRNFMWYAHILKDVVYVDEQAFLIDNWKKLHITRAAFVTDHGKARNLVGRSVSSFDCDKVSAHLITLIW